jgi:hypothetical protein
VYRGAACTEAHIGRVFSVKRAFFVLFSKSQQFFAALEITLTIPYLSNLHYYKCLLTGIRSVMQPKFEDCKSSFEAARVKLGTSKACRLCLSKTIDTLTPAITRSMHAMSQVMP